MKTYELVILLQPQLSKDDHEKLVNDIEKQVKDQGGSILATDDMGLMTLTHEITKARLKQAYFISYHIELPSDKVTSLKSSFAITKGIVRFFFFMMGAHEAFVIHKDVNKTWEPKEDAKPKETVVKKGFFADKDTTANINWKATNFLRHYMTRFGDIKPRHFMGNKVRHQKKVRQAIIRARELGVLPYAN